MKNFIFYFLLIFNVTLRGQNTCSLDQYDLSKSVFEDLFYYYGDLAVAMFAEGEKIRNVCGEKYGYRLYFDVSNFPFESNVSLSISLTSSQINPIAINSDGIISNLNQVSNVITFDLNTNNNADNYCGSILFSIPDTNPVDDNGDYYLNKYLGWQGFDLEITNNLTNIVENYYLNTYNECTAPL